MVIKKNPAANSQVSAPKILLSPAQIDKCIRRLEDRINELQNFSAISVPAGTSPALTALEAAIQDTLARCFGEGTVGYKRFEDAARLNLRVSFATSNYPLLIHYQEGAQKNINSSLHLLREAQRVLREDLEDAVSNQAQVEATGSVIEQKKRQISLTRRVFVVHGHDEGARETVARFLEKIGFEPIILHEQASRNRTVIEKIEAFQDVDFAVVLLTPDDEGCVKGGELKPRARQNVILELGYFMGRLGREKVCALKRGAVDIPSDFAGVVWVEMDSGIGWKQALGHELSAAGHEIDWNKVMR